MLNDVALLESSLFYLPSFCNQIMLLIFKTVLIADLFLVAYGLLDNYPVVSSDI